MVTPSEDESPPQNAFPLSILWEDPAPLLIRKGRRSLVSRVMISSFLIPSGFSPFFQAGLLSNSGRTTRHEPAEHRSSTQGSPRNSSPRSSGVHRKSRDVLLFPKHSCRRLSLSLSLRETAPFLFRSQVRLLAILVMTVRRDDGLLCSLESHLPLTQMRTFCLRQSEEP